MKLEFLCFLLFWICWSSAASGDVFDLGEASFQIEFVDIGSLGNAPNTLVEQNIEQGIPRVSAGGVSYDYRIAKYELPFEVLHLANELGGLEIEIREEPARPDLPISGLTWSTFARLTNWLNEVQGYPHAYKFLFQPGDERYRAGAGVREWSPEDPGYDPNNRVRNARAKYVLPTSDEWYKAAFYDPEEERYFAYVGSDSPLTAVASGNMPGTAVFETEGPAAVMDAGGPNQYGLVGMAGNLSEWSESASTIIPDFPSEQRRLHFGGSFLNRPEHGTSLRLSTHPQDLAPTSFGIRIAAVPEPDASRLTAIAVLLSSLIARGRRHVT